MDTRGGNGPPDDRGQPNRALQSQPSVPAQLFRALRRAKLHRRPRVIGLTLLWAFGLFAVFLAPAPVKISESAMQSFEAGLDNVAIALKPRRELEEEWAQAEWHVRDAKVWFWWFKPEHKAVVRERQKVAAAAKARVAVVDKAAEQELFKAKSKLGLWSEAGISEGRSLFWKAFESGKVFGRRQTLWDGIIALLTSREDGVLIMFIQLIFSAAVNFTVGLCVSVFVFAFQLPSLLWSYRAGLLSSSLFFVVAVVGALSVVASFLILLYGAGATAIYSIATLAGPARLGGRRQHPANLRYHYE